MQDLLTVKDAAEMLGVSQLTVRRWCNSGKLPHSRHPINGYRLFCEDALIQIRQKMGTNMNEDSDADK
jgi:excisionase family DNA binding protein